MVASAAVGRHHLPGVRARGLLGGATTVVRGSLAADGTFSLAAVEPRLQVLLEAILWRGDGAGVGPVLAGVWVEEEEDEDKEDDEVDKDEEEEYFYR